MATVTLLSPLGQSVKSKLPYGQTLLNLAGSLNLPLYTECRMQRCGACAVKVAVLDDRGAGQVGIGEVERSILYSAGKISREQFKSAAPPDNRSLWRIACQYVVGNEEIVVAL